MARVSGTHFQGPVLGSRDLTEDVGIQDVNQRDVISWFNDFIWTDDFDTTAWTLNDIGVPAATNISIEADAHGGILLVDPGTTVSTGRQAQYTGTGPAGEFLDLANTAANGKFLAWEARFKVDAFAQGTLWIGMGETDTSLISAGGAEGCTNSFSVRTLTTGNLFFGSRVANSTAASLQIAGALANDTYIRVGMAAQLKSNFTSDTTTTSIDCYVNGVKRGSISAAGGVLNAVGYCPSVAAVNAAGALLDGRVDYFWVAFQR